jgi:hypothetical protein
LIKPENTLFQNKVTFIGVGVLTFNMAFYEGEGAESNTQGHYKIENLNVFLDGSCNEGNLKTLMLKLRLAPKEKVHHMVLLNLLIFYI